MKTKGCLCYGITDPVLQFLLFPRIPSGNVLEVTGDPAYLDDIMRPAFRADGGMAQWTIIDPRKDLMGAVTVIKGAHNLEVFLATLRARCLIDNKVAGMTLVPAFGSGNIFEVRVFFCNFSLVCGPIHTIR
jgi:hypothetical protein